MFTLICSCESMDFHYNLESGFKCKHCGMTYTAEEAGQHLIEIEELDVNVSL